MEIELLSPPKGRRAGAHYEGAWVEYKDLQASVEAGRPLMTLELYQEYMKGFNGERKGSHHIGALFEAGGQTFKVPRSKCVDRGSAKGAFSIPGFYKLPQQGEAGRGVVRILKAILAGRHVFVHGPAGTGKSATVRAILATLGVEASHYPMREGMDPELYLGRTVVTTDPVSGASITKFEKGPLLLDLEGRVGTDGVRRPVYILFDDIDRGPSEYHEILRHLLEENARNIFVPEIGQSVNVFPGTVVIATANSAGRGDASSLYASVQVMDESILDRFGVCVTMPHIDEAEETAIYKARFHELYEVAPRSFDYIMKSTAKIRGLIKESKIYGSFSIRRVLNWFHSLDTNVKFELENGTSKSSLDTMLVRLVLESSKDWLDWFNDEDRLTIERSVLTPVIGTI